MAYAGDAYAATPYAGSASPVIISGSPWTAPATWRDGATTTPIRMDGQAWDAPAAWLDGTIPAFTPIAVSGEPWASASTWRDGSLSSVITTGTSWAAPATWLDGLIVGASVLVDGTPWTVPADWIDGAQTVAVLTEERNRTNGRSRTGSGENHTALVAASTTTTEPIRIMAQQLPTPTLKNGRPQ